MEYFMKFNFKFTQIFLGLIVSSIISANISATNLDRGIDKYRGYNIRPSTSTAFSYVPTAAPTVAKPVAELKPSLKALDKLLAQEVETLASTPDLGTAGVIPATRDAARDAALVLRLNKAIDAGDLAGVEKALRQGANPNALSNLPLAEPKGGFWDQTEVANHLDEPEDNIIPKDTTGIPALARAVFSTRPAALEIIRKLIAYHANVNAKVEFHPENPNIWHIFSLALMNGQNPADLEILETLIAAGAKTDTADAKKALDRGLMEGILWNRASLVKFARKLIDWGADVNSRSDDNSLYSEDGPLTEALRRDVPPEEVIAILRKAGAIEAE